ncbi:xanthine dehydrogenase small subunit [Stappia sp.]|uniref:xanthine dehydrogenase small subunit n=1 Tax=Stappia sp. TaxID=1870903 RepID=UPI003A9A1F9F
MRRQLRFLHKGQIVELADVRPTETVLDYLRLRRGLVGTKEGCGEGDCGACTVAIGRLVEGRLVYQPVNSCIQFLGMLDGAELVTVEDLAQDGRLHPVQQAMVDCHGSQCGFCTPGFIMSLFTLYHAPDAQPTRKTVTDWLAGNLCRCTGYRPIVDAAMEACFQVADDAFSRRAEETTAALLEMAGDPHDLWLGDEQRFFAAPASLDALAALCEAHPQATIVAGATDVGLWVTKQLRDLPQVIWLGRVRDFEKVEETSGGVLMGAGATFSDTHAFMARIDPDLGELWRRIGSRQVRASGTVCGNIANGSPIGDSPPALIALGATLELRKGAASRTVALEDFFIDYGKQDRAPGEIVTGLYVPRLDPNHAFRCFKISKRFDQDITAVLCALRLTLADGIVTDARLAFGGMAATPRRAAKAELALIGARPDQPSSWAAALKALGDDFDPISDMRASDAYRREVARALLAKSLVEIGGTPDERTRVTGLRGGETSNAA